MKRRLTDLNSTRFDLIVVGGGIFGAFAAWDAAFRGLSVALIERSDFGAATSANSYKIVHGGIRYIQHGDVQRVRRSSLERRAFLRIAPHLVRPLPIVVPTYGHGMRGRLALRLGAGLYDALTVDRNTGLVDPGRRIAPARTIGRREVLDLFPGLESEGLTGAAIFEDAQMYNPPRIVLAVVKSAASKGAVVANYLEATGLVRDGVRVAGVSVRDLIHGAEFEISGRVVLNAAGPYAESFLDKALGLRLSPPGTYSRDACFVVPRPWVHPRYALAIQGRTRDSDAILSRGERHLFAAPWRGYSLIGTWHRVHTGDVERLEVKEDELEAYVSEINSGYRDLDLSVDDVSVVNRGLVPFGGTDRASGDLQFGHRSQVVDHAKVHEAEGLISLIGVRFTTGRWEAKRAIDLAFRKLGVEAPPAGTATTAVVGGRIPDWASFVAELSHRHSARVDDAVLTSLAHNYGTEAEDVLALAEQSAELRQRLGASATIKAQVIHAVREEMARNLADVVLRRTDLATAEYPGRTALVECGKLIASELGLTDGEMERQVVGVERRFPKREIERSAVRMKA